MNYRMVKLSSGPEKISNNLKFGLDILKTIEN